MKITTLTVVFLLVVSACATPRFKQPHDRCNVSELDWTAIQGKPEQADALISSLENWNPGSEAFWFQSGDDRLLLCSSPKYDRLTHDRVRRGCWSSRRTFSRIGDTWIGDQSSRTPSVTLCH